MHTNASAFPSRLRRRSLLGMAVIAIIPMSRSSLGAPAKADPVSTIERFHEALLTVMKAGTRTDFSRRVQVLAPEVDEAFDLSAVLAVSVGPGWASVPPDQQSRLLAAFRRYTVASYVANFDNYSGESFAISPQTRNLGPGRVMVESRIVPVSGEATELGYVMQGTQAGWKVVDVLEAGSISRVAVQRSDFRRILSNGGGDALVASLQRKFSDLSGEAPA